MILNFMTSHCHNADHNSSYATFLTSDLEATGKVREPLDNNKNGIRHKKYHRRTFGTNSHA